MSDFITLTGAEDVRSAGYMMRDAAASIAQSVAELEDILRRHREELRELLGPERRQP